MLHRYVGPDATDSSRNWHGYTKSAECQSKRWESFSKPELRENADIFDSKIIEKGRSQDTDETPIWPGKECKRVVDCLTSEAVRPQGIDSSHFVNSSLSFSNLRTWSPPPHHGLSLQQARSRYGPSRSKGKVAAKRATAQVISVQFLICSNSLAIEAKTSKCLTGLAIALVPNTCYMSWNFWHKMFVRKRSRFSWPPKSALRFKSYVATAVILSKHVKTTSIYNIIYNIYIYIIMMKGHWVTSHYWSYIFKF